MTALVPTDLPASVPSRTYREEPPQRSIVLRIFLALVVLGLGAAVVGFIRDLADAPAAGPAGPAVTVRSPERLGGRAKTTDDEWAQAGAHAAFADGAKAAVYETYGTALDENAVMVFAAAGAIASPERAVGRLLLSVREQGYTVMDFSEIDPGPLGGVARCGMVSGEGRETAMCVWADHGSNGIVEWYFSSLGEARAEFVSVRAEIEARV